jgi:transcriptional regulator with XRE-family HTH domain
MPAIITPPLLCLTHSNHPDALRDYVCTQMLLRRNELGMTAIELSRRTDLSPQTIRNNEEHTHNPGILTLERQCQGMGTSITLLLCPLIVRMDSTSKILG